MDLGIAFQPTNTNLMLGLVAKNVNSPKFKIKSSNAGASVYEVGSFLRAGICIPFLKDSFEFAFLIY